MEAAPWQQFIVIWAGTSAAGSLDTRRVFGVTVSVRYGTLPALTGEGDVPSPTVTVRGSRPLGVLVLLSVDIFKVYLSEIRALRARILS